MGGLLLIDNKEGISPEGLLQHDGNGAISRVCPLTDIISNFALREEGRKRSEQENKSLYTKARQNDSRKIMSVRCDTSSYIGLLPSASSRFDPLLSPAGDK